MPSGGSDASWTASDQQIYQPQSDALREVYADAPDMYQNYMSSMQDGKVQQDLTNWNQGVQKDSQSMWQNQMGGGNLGGYDIAGALQGQIQNDQGRYITPNMIGGQQVQGQNVQGANVQGTNVQGQDATATMAGPVTQSWEDQVYNDRVGPGGSVANMEGMYRRQANDARSDMLGATDARAAASGMGGGSAHGNAVGRGMEGINTNLQNQMATTGYDAYNRDLDRHLAIGQRADANNQQRALSDQNAANQFGLSNQANNMQGQLANQANNMQGQLANQQNSLQSQQLNQANNMQGQLANQANNMQGQMANQQAGLQAGQMNQNFASNNQQMLAQLAGMQNANQQGALGQSGAMAGLGNLGYQSAMAPMQGWAQMLQNMGPPTVLNNSWSESKGMNFGV